MLDGYVRDQLGDSLRGRKVAVVVHLEAKTAFLATVLHGAGAEVVVAGSNPRTTRDEVAAALVDRGVEVHSSRSTTEVWESDLASVAATGPDYVVDDGAELTIRMARDHPEAFGGLLGVSEQTTTGVERLRRLEAAGRLPMPAIAANDAACKHMFDNRYGTGQSAVQAILNLTNLRLAGKRVAVIGYGWVGRGLALYIRALGGRVTAVEVDPIRALEALSDGHEVSDLTTALSEAAIVITATGGRHVLGGEHLQALGPSAVLANAGHHDEEIDVGALRRSASSVEEVRPGVTRYQLGSKPVFLLAEGALVNITGGLGHPVEIMDLSFSVQAMGLLTLVTAHLPPGVHQFPPELDGAIAAAKLATRGIRLEGLAEEQADTLADLLDLDTIRSWGRS